MATAATARGANPFDSSGVTPDENGVRRYDELHESLIEMLRESVEANPSAEALVEVGTAVRRYKSEHTLALGAPLQRVHVATQDAALAALLREAQADIASVTRARQVEIGRDVDPALETVTTNRLVSVGIINRP